MKPTHSDAPLADDTFAKAPPARSKAVSVIESESSTSPNRILFAFAAAKALSSCVVGTVNAIQSPQFGYRMFGIPTSTIQEEEESQAAIKTISRKLRAASSEQLEYGNRIEYMRSALESHIKDSPSMFVDAISRVLATSDSHLSTEAKAAALRYLGIYDSPIETSKLSKLFISHIKHAPELEAIAAARSLAEMGDSGSIPLLREAAKISGSNAVKEATELAIKDIGETYGYSTGS